MSHCLSRLTTTTTTTRGQRRQRQIEAGDTISMINKIITNAAMEKERKKAQDNMNSLSDIS